MEGDDGGGGGKGGGGGGGAGGGGGGGVGKFLRELKALGFDCKRQDNRSNKMFVLLDCIKSPAKPKTLPAHEHELELKPCRYKRR